MSPHPPDKTTSNHIPIFSFLDLSHEKRNHTTAAFVVILVSFAVHLLFAFQLQLIQQEAYYWLWSTVPSLSYYDHPPMIAWMIWASTTVFGNGEVAVRLPSLLLSAGTCALMYHFTSSLFDQRAGFYSVLIYSAALIFQVKGIMVDPDVPLIFFYLLSVVFFHKALNEKGILWWVLLGIAVGCSLLSKYTGILVFGSFLLVLIFSSEHRNLPNFLKLVLASFVALAVFSPVIVWNYQHDWISFFYQGARRSSDFSFNAGYFFGYFGAQAGIVIPFIYAAMLYALVHGFVLFRRVRDERALFLLSFAIPFLVVFTFAAARTWVKLNWLLPGYLTLIILLAGMACGFFPVYREKLHRRMLWSLDVGVKLGIGLAFVALLVAFLPFSLTKQATKSLHGWREAGELIDKRIAELVAKGEAKDPFIYSHPYKLASELAYYCKQFEATSTQIYGENDRAFNYLFPNFRTEGRDGIFIIDKKLSYHSLSTATYHFKQRIKLDDIRVEIDGETLKEFEVYLMKLND